MCVCECVRARCWCRHALLKWLAAAQTDAHRWEKLPVIVIISKEQLLREPKAPFVLRVPLRRCAFTCESVRLSDKCVCLPAQIVCLGDKCAPLPGLRACLPGEPRASRSRPGSRRQPGV